jgi:hypothetical protein
MFRFFIHMEVDGQLQRDDVGMLCECPELAYLHACRAIPEIAAEMLRRRKDPMTCSFIIENIKGEEMFVVPFDEVVRTPAHH